MLFNFLSSFRKPSALILAIVSVYSIINNLNANLHEQIPTTATNMIGAQYLNPFRKELKKIDTAITNIQKQIKKNPASQDQQQPVLANLFQAHHQLVNFITDREITLNLFALNEVLNQETSIPLIDDNDYEHNLYVACSPLDKDQGTYQTDDHLLHHLAASRTHLTSGYIKWAKTLAMPTSNVDALRRTQNVSKELLRNDDLRKKLEDILQQIKEDHLEDSFLSFWKDEAAAKIISNAPYATNSNFAPVIELLFALKGIKGGDTKVLQEAIEKLDTSPAFIGTVNWSTFIQDAGMIMFGVSMVTHSWQNLRETVSAIPHDFSYLGGWKALALPIILPVIRYLAGKIIDLSLKNRMRKELTRITTLCEENQKAPAQTCNVSIGKIDLAYETEQQAIDAKALITKEMPHCQVTTDTNNRLMITLTKQEERAFRFAHPLMKHETLATIVIPCIGYLFACHIGSGTPLLSWDAVGNIPFTNTPIPVPGFTLLPWHLIKSLTSVGLIPAYAYQHFWKTPQKSMLSTTHSIQLARKVLLDFAQLINHVKQIQKLLLNNRVIRENLQQEINELDVEKGLHQKIEFARMLLKQNDAFLQKNGISKDDMKISIAYLEEVQKELSTLLDTLQSYDGETEIITPHSWFSPTGFIKNLKIRFGSNNLLAAYKTMSSIKDAFAPWLEALGEIDRKLSEAALLKDFEHQNVTFCFAEYEDQASPHIAATNVWLPHLLHKGTPANIVANSLEMGKDGQATTIILSGPTEGGKSTFERALAIAVLMAMTCGIVPAERWVSTPFDRILLSFNATDNLSKNESGFATEVSMIKKIVQQKNTCSPGNNILIIIDELFQKVQRSGEYLSYQVIKDNFIDTPHALNLIVSHREQPKQLELETAGRCQNYHFILRNEKGRLVNTYRIESGVLLRPRHTAVTLAEILGNAEDAKNLQMVHDAGLISS